MTFWRTNSILPNLNFLLKHQPRNSSRRQYRQTQSGRDAVCTARRSYIDRRRRSRVGPVFCLRGTCLDQHSQFTWVRVPCQMDLKCDRMCFIVVAIHFFNDICHEKCLGTDARVHATFCQWSAYYLWCSLALVAIVSFRYRSLDAATFVLMAFLSA